MKTSLNESEQASSLTEEGQKPRKYFFSASTESHSRDIDLNSLIDRHLLKERVEEPKVPLKPKRPPRGPDPQLV